MEDPGGEIGETPVKDVKPQAWTRDVVDGVSKKKASREEGTVIEIPEGAGACVGQEDETPKNLEEEPTEEPTEELKRQVRALRKNQLDILKVDHWFYSQMHDLETKAAKMMEPHWKRRAELITGTGEPTDEEALFQVERESLTPEQAREIKRVEPKVAVGHYWPAIFENCDNLAMVTEVHDMDVLKNLIDIKVEVTQDPMSFKLHFHFMPNEYFTDSLLTKTYQMTNEIDPSNPFIYDGTEITKSVGCKIHWNEGKDVTKKIITKRQKHKQTGHVRNIEQVVDVESFFTFFSPPDISKATSEEEKMEFDDRLKLDYRLGQFIRENLVPRATMYFTGEAQIIEEMFASSGDEVSDDSDDSDEDESDDAGLGEGGDT